MKLSLFVMMLTLVSIRFASAEPVTTSIHEIKLDMKTIVDFSKLDEAKMVEALRKDHKVKVIVIDDLKRGEAGNAKLKGLNIDDDKEAIKFYESPKTAPLALVPNAQTMFLQPYERIQAKVESIDDFFDRPYQDEPVMLISEKATRFQLIIIFTHYQAWKSRGLRHETIKTVKLSPTSAAKFEVDELQRKLVKLGELLEAEKDDAKKARLAIEMSGELLNALDKAMALQHQVSGLELDICRVLLDKAGDLKLDAKERAMLLLVATTHLRAVTNGVESVSKSMKAEPFITVVKNDEKLKARAEKVIDAIGDYQHTYRKVLTWLEEAAADEESKK